MLILQDSYILYPLLQKLYPELKFWSWFIAGLWGMFKLVNWVKAIKDNHLHHIQLGIDTIGNDIKELGPEFNKAVDKQTDIVVSSFNSLRDDIRMLTAAMLAQPVKDRTIEIKVKDSQ